MVIGLKLIVMAHLQRRQALADGDLSSGIMMVLSEGRVLGKSLMQRALQWLKRRPARRQFRLLQPGAWGTCILKLTH
jgi:hypothetical protein